MRDARSRRLGPTFATGRHGWAAAILGLCTIALVYLSLSSTIVGQFWGSPDLRYLRIPEFVGVAGILCVGVCLLPGMPSFEASSNRRIQLWYFNSVFVTCLLPLIAAVVVGELMRLHLHPDWNAAQDAPEFGFHDLLPRVMAAQAFNAVFVGACLLIVLRYWGIVTALIGGVLLYAVLIWESAQPWAHLGPYAAQWMGVVVRPHMLWAMCASLLAGYLWARISGPQRGVA